MIGIGKIGRSIPEEGVFLQKMPLREQRPDERNLSAFAFVSRDGHRAAWNFPIADIPGAPLEQDPADRQS